MTSLPAEQTGGAGALASRRNLHLGEIGVGLVAFLAWLLLLAAGILVGTASYRETLAHPAGLGFLTLFGDLLIVTLCYTWTNAALLCPLASFLGGLCQWSKADSRERGYLSIILPGFFVYVVAASGILFVGNTTALLNPTSPTVYVKLAGLVSLLSFCVGYDPRFFATSIERVEQVIVVVIQRGDRSSRTTPPAPPTTSDDPAP